MPAVVDQHTIEIRLTWLAVDRQKLVEEQPTANNERMAAIEERLKEIRYREAECKDWLHILNQDPGWGDLITVDGRKVPKMPTFRTPEERERRLKNWGKKLPEKEQKVKQAREYRAMQDAREDVAFMDGIGPIAAREYYETDTDGAEEADLQFDASRQEFGEGGPEGNGPEGSEPDGSESETGGSDGS